MLGAQEAEAVIIMTARDQASQTIRQVGGSLEGTRKRMDMTNVSSAAMLKNMSRVNTTVGTVQRSLTILNPLLLGLGIGSLTAGLGVQTLTGFIQRNREETENLEKAANRFRAQVVASGGDIDSANRLLEIMQEILGKKLAAELAENADLMEFLSEVSEDSAIGILENAKDISQGLGADIGEAVIAARAMVQNNFGPLNEIIARGSKTTKVFVTTMEEAQAAIREGTGAAQEARDAIEEFNLINDAHEESMKRIVTAWDVFGNALDEIPSKVDAVTEANKRQLPTLQDLLQGWLNLLAAQSKAPGGRAMFVDEEFFPGLTPSTNPTLSPPPGESGDERGNYPQSGVGDISNVGLSPEDLAHRRATYGFQTGGTVPGVPGQAVPIIAHAGETIVPRGRAQLQGGGQSIVIQLVLDHRVLEEVVVETMRQAYVRAGVGPGAWTQGG